MNVLYIRDPSGKFVPVPTLSGKDGRSAYQYAQDGGYTGTEAEFAEKLAEELPEPYTLPTASDTVKGGVKVGKGLMMDGEALGVVPENEFELIDRVVVGCELLAEKPADWLTNYGDYYMLLDSSIYKCNSAAGWADGKIYKAVDFEPFGTLLLNKEPDGTPYNFSKIVAVNYILPITDAPSGGSINYSWGNNCVLTLPHLSSSTTYWCAVEARIENGIVTAKGSHTSSKWGNMDERVPFSDRTRRYADALTEFKAQCVGAEYTYSRGTMFEIWGVRAK